MNVKLHPNSKNGNIRLICDNKVDGVKAKSANGRQLRVVFENAFQIQILSKYTYLSLIIKFQRNFWAFGPHKKVQKELSQRHV